MNILHRFYNVLWRIAPPIIRFYLRRRARKNPAYLLHQDERFGVPQKNVVQGVLWLHAVSVGETRAAVPIIRILQQRFPDLPLLITQMTPTGRETAQNVFPNAQCRYLPYDRPDFVAQFLDEHRPLIGIFMETEIWINLLAACDKRHIPIILANARLSAKSAAGYQRFHKLFQAAFNSFSAVLAQSEQDAQRFKNLGLSKVYVCGNSKYDISPDEKSSAIADDFRRKIGGRKIFVCASTREKDGIDEADLLLQAWRKYGDKNILLVIIPRHPERFQAAFDIAQKYGFCVKKRSNNEKISAYDEVWIGDSMGELSAYYCIADVAFVGGSLVDTGCQNIIEPIACNVPVLFGFSTYNFQQACADALQAKVAIQVQNADECVHTALRLINNADIISSDTQNFMRRHQGAAQRMAEYISGCLKV